MSSISMWRQKANCSTAWRLYSLYANAEAYICPLESAVFLPGRSSGAVALYTAMGTRITPTIYLVCKTCTPVTACELSQFLKCCKCMAFGIPQFGQRASVLTALLEKTYVASGRQTTPSIRCFQLGPVVWRPTQNIALKDLQSALKSADTLGYPASG